MRNSGEKWWNYERTKAITEYDHKQLKYQIQSHFGFQRCQPLYVDIFTIMLHDLVGAQIAFCVTSNKYVLSFQ